MQVNKFCIRFIFILEYISKRGGFLLKLRKYAFFALIVLNLLTINVVGAYNTDEIDTLRANLACQKDKSSQSYIKSQEKLKKIISQSQMDYSTKGRINDAVRLINERKYDAANKSIVINSIIGY